MLDNPKNESCETIELRNKMVTMIVNFRSEKKVNEGIKKNEVEREVEDE